MSKVSVVNVPLKPLDEEVFEGVKKSIDLLGGPGRFASSGDRVVVKPNILNGDYEGSTDRRVLYSVAKVFVDSGCKVIIGENPLVNTNSAEEFKKYGIREIARRAGAEFVDFRRDEHGTVEVKNAKGCETLKIARTVLDADCVVSVPVMKTHTMCMVTLSVKNLWGTIPPTQRYLGHRNSLNWTLAELNKIVKTKLAVIDGTTAFGAPHVGSFPLGMIIAGDDPVAADSIATLRMGYDPYRIEHLRYSHELGVGEINPSKIDLIGAELKDLKKAGRTQGRKRFMLKGYMTNPRTLLRGADNVELVMGNPCSSCVWKFNTALRNLGVKKIRSGPEIAVLLGPGAKPVKGRFNVILGGCLKEYKDQGVFVDFCPVYNQDVEQAISVALGEKKEFEFMWDGLLKTYSEKEDKSLPGF